MPEERTNSIDFSEMPLHTSKFRYFTRVFFRRKVVVFGMIVVVTLIMTAILAPVLAPYDPYETNLSQALLQPCHNHLLGTDALGRETLSRIIYGTRIALMVGVIAVSIAASIGISLGLIAGYFGGKVYAVIMRFTDALIAVPMILLAMFAVCLIGGGLKNVMMAVGISLVPIYVRVMCVQTLSIKENDYIIAAHAIGGSNLHVMLRHLAPNCFPPLIVLMTMQLGQAILVEASLSFLGIGISPPAAAWGAMVSDGYRYLLTNPVLSFSPGLAIMLVVFSFNMVGDGLRDTLDPRLRGVI